MKTHRRTETLFLGEFFVLITSVHFLCNANDDRSALHCVTSVAYQNIFVLRNYPFGLSAGVHIKLPDIACRKSGQLNINSVPIGVYAKINYLVKLIVSG